MYELMIQIVDTSNAGRKVIQTTWVTVDALAMAQMRADAIASNAPSWLGGDTIQIAQEGRVLKSRPLGQGW